jgi:signal transduction histidine kinase
MNIISNAVDALPAENGRILISACRLEAAVKISIEDNGHGMAPEVQARIFDPFYTTKDVGKGTGLGLHIAKKEVERHGGDIAVESQPNVGTTFTILLPDIDAKTQEQQEAA